MNIPQSAIEPFEPLGMATLNYTPKAMVYFIDIAMGIKHKYLQRIIDIYGKRSHLFDLGELRTIAKEFGADHIKITNVSKGFMELTYTVPNDSRKYVRHFRFIL
jgi:hypothetical protein